MFDGAAFITGAEVVENQVTQDLPALDQEIQAIDTEAETFSDPFTNSIDLFSALTTTTVPSDRNEIIFIDTSVEDYQTLLLGIAPNAEAILLDSTRDGIEQIAEILGDRSGIDAIHIISHGNQGELHLGTGVLNLASMQGEYADELAIINQALTDEADFLIYGCNFGEGKTGQDAATLLAKLTGADIAASDDLTGSAQLGGDWELEVQTGTIESTVIVNEQAQLDWSGLLATINVMNTNDSGAGSLRQAIIDSNSSIGTTDTINLPSGTYTLLGAAEEDAAASGDLDITDDVIIVGAGATTTIIDGSSNDRIFDLRGTSTATISGLTIQNGNHIQGGGFFLDNASTLNLTDAVVQNNSSTQGGALHIHGTTNLDRVLLFNNTSSNTGGAVFIHGGSAGASFTNVTISGNTATGDGGGVWTNKPITVTNSTIANNTGSDGGGIFSNNSTVTLSNTIVSDNTTSSANDDVVGTFISDGSNLIETVGSATGFVGGDLTGASANLGGLADYGGPTQTHALLAGNLAINAGTNIGAPTVDQRGFTRDGTPDIGAFEFGGNGVNQVPVNVVPLTQTTNQDATLVFSSGTSNQISISDPDAGSSDVQVTLTATNGTATLAGITGLTFSIGDGTGDATMTFVGTIANINTALNGLMFTPTTSYSGAASLEIITKDQGSTGTAPLDGDANLTTKYTFDVDGADAIGVNDATLNNGAAVASDVERGNVLNTDGVDDYAEIPSAVTNGLTQFTFSFWVKTTESRTNALYWQRPTLFGMEITGLGVNDFAINTNNGFIGFWTGLSGADADYLSTTTQVNDNQWHQITVSNDGANASLYVDGAFEASLATGNSLSADTFYIGGLHTTTGGPLTATHSGFFDDVRIFNRSLTTQEADDLFSLSDTDSVAITVNATPVNTIPGAQVAVEDTALGISGLSVNDTDSNLSTVQLAVTQGRVTVILGGGASISAGGNGTSTLTLSGTEAAINTTLASLSYQSNLNYNGPDTLTVTSTDSNSATAVDMVGITVTAVNDAPAFNGLNNAPTFIEGGAAVVLDNNATIADPELDAANNYNGATLTLARNGGANGNDVFNGSGTLNTLTESGSLVVGSTTIGTVTTNSAGTLLLTFNGNATTARVNSALQQITYHNTNATPPANVQIDFTIDDGNVSAQGSGPALDATGSITVTITDTNISPVAMADGFSVNHGSTTILNLAGNDSDIDDGLDLTSITIVSDPTNGTIDSINTDGTVTYTHSGSATITDSFTYTINDLAATTSNTVTVSLTVLNGAPVAVLDGFTVNEGSTNTLNLAGNDTDPDDGLDLTSITIDSGPINGSIDSINTNGTVEYTHNGSETLLDSFTYTINDVGGNTSNTVTVSLTITPQNDAPIITSDGSGPNASVNILTGNTATTDVNAFDAEGSPLTYSITGGADAALFTIDPATGVLAFITAPNIQTPGNVGNDNVYDVIVGASDGTLTDTQAIAVTITDLPVVVLPPTADPPSESPSESGEEHAGESEDEVSGNVLLPGSNSHGHGSGGNQNSTGDNPNDSNQLNHLAKDDAALIQHLRKGNGIKGTAENLMGLFQQSFDRTSLKSEITSLIGTSSGFLKDLDEARDALNDVVATEKTYVASSIAASTGLSVGYVFWLLRSGVLLTALLSSVPAWQFVNPLLVLDTPTKKKRLKSQEDPEDDSVESMFENHTEPTQTAQNKIEENPKSH